MNHDELIKQARETGGARSGAVVVPAPDDPTGEIARKIEQARRVQAALLLHGLKTGQVLPIVGSEEPRD